MVKLVQESGATYVKAAQPAGKGGGKTPLEALRVLELLNPEPKP